MRIQIIYASFFTFLRALTHILVNNCQTILSWECHSTYIKTSAHIQTIIFGAHLLPGHLPHKYALI